MARRRDLLRRLEALEAEVEQLRQRLNERAAPKQSGGRTKAN